jgi:predicted MFS family arabinose efflux permease
MSAATAGGLAVFRQATRHSAQSLWERGSALVGGQARARVILILAAALGLQGADVATLSATANDLQRAFGINNTAIGLLVSVTALAGALGTIPIGVLTDRTRRTRLLAISIGLWAVAMLFAGAAASFVWLLIARVGLGVVTATTGPTIASLTGDFFPARSRARMLGYILGGELVGTGIGFIVSGEIAALVNWRFAFWWLVVPTAALIWLVWRLPEPARDGQSRLEPGQTEIRDEREVDPANSPSADIDSTGEEADTSAAQIARGKRVGPQRELVLTTDPTDRSLWWAVRYILRVRTYVVIIIASALGYFYFAGLQSFVMIFVTSHYRISQSVASVLTVVVGIGAVGGVYLGGRTADRMLGRGRLNARLVVPAVALFGVVVVLAPALATTSLGLALPLLTVSAGLLGAANPPLDAARLDIIHPAMWGRAESVRTVLRMLAQGTSPLLFGWVSESVFGGRHGLEYTFLVFLIVLIIAGALALTAIRSYPRDVATAAESYRRQPITD